MPVVEASVQRDGIAAEREIMYHSLWGCLAASSQIQNGTFRERRYSMSKGSKLFVTAGFGPMTGSVRSYASLNARTPRCMQARCTTTETVRGWLSPASLRLGASTGTASAR